MRSQDIKRWSPEWADMWMIILKSSNNHSWPWSGIDESTAEELFRQAYPSIYAHLKPLEARLRTRQDKGRYWWELRACAYYEYFDQPKIIHTDITWRPQFAFSNSSAYLLNSAYMWPTTDLYLLAVVNSPLLWTYMWSNAMHGKDEALRLIYSFTEALPIAPPSEATRMEAEQAVARLIQITQVRQEVHRLILDWLRMEFEIQEPGSLLKNATTLEVHAFIEEVQKHRPKSARRLTPAALRDLQTGYAEQIVPLQQQRIEALTLEHRLSDLINSAYVHSV